MENYATRSSGLAAFETDLLLEQRSRGACGLAEDACFLASRNMTPLIVEGRLFKLSGSSWRNLWMW